MNRRGAQDEHTQSGPARPRAELIRRKPLSRFAPYFVLLAALLSTVAAWHMATLNVERVAAERFENRAAGIRTAIIDRMAAYQQLLRAGAALFAGSDHVSSDEWQRFYLTLRVNENYPGLLGFGYAKHLAQSERDAFIAAIRTSENPGFDIMPPGLRAEYTPVVYLQPVTASNRKVIGYDMFSEPARRAAMQHAAASGRTTVSGKVLLLLDQLRGRSQPGFLMYQPVFASNAATAREPGRPVYGYVYGAFRMNDLMSALFSRRGDVAIAVYDGKTPTAQSLLYDSGAARTRTARFRVRTPVTIGERDWTIEVVSQAEFEAAVSYETPRVIIGAGTAISLLLFALVSTLSRVRERALALARDMTAAIKENEQRLREITASLGEGVYVKDLNGLITFVNPEAEKLLGWSAGEVLGQNAHSVYHHHKLDGAEYPLEECPIMQAALSGVAYRAEDYFWHKNGSVVPVSITSTPIYRDGKLAGAVNVFHDITERRRNEAQLRESEQFRALFEYAREALFLVDTTGHIVDVNQIAAESLGFNRAEIIGRLAREYLLSPMWGDGSTTVTNIRSRRSPDAPLVFEGEQVRRDGSRFAVEALFSPIQVGSRKLILVAARDITERKRAERERRELLARERQAREAAEAAQRSLARSNADLEHFAYAASHDLQEPLRMVTAYNQLLQKRYSGKLDADADQFIEFSITGARRMEQLLQGLLAYLRIAAADEPVESVEPVDANVVLAEARQNLHTAIEESGAAILVTDPLPRVRAHPVHLLQLFQNLIGNAIKYRGSENPRIEIGVRAEDGRWLFSIADNGMGIEPRYAEQIFGIFKRLHGDKYSGTGIGLAICQKIVERYGGKIWVESESGRGSVFYFSLPN